MAGPHSVDIQLLHKFEVLYHPFTCYHITTVRIHLVAVCSLEEDWLPVDQHLCVFDFNFAETDPERNCFKLFPSPGILGMYIQII